MVSEGTGWCFRAEKLTIFHFYKSCFKKFKTGFLCLFICNKVFRYAGLRHQTFFVCDNMEVKKLSVWSTFNWSIIQLQAQFSSVCLSWVTFIKIRSFRKINSCLNGFILLADEHNLLFVLQRIILIQPVFTHFLCFLSLAALTLCFSSVLQLRQVIHPHPPWLLFPPTWRHDGGHASQSRGQD